MRTLFFTLPFLLCGTLRAQGVGEPTSSGMSKKILFVLTSHATKGSTGEPTGYYLSEVSHPWSVLTRAGYTIDFVSPQGGEPPVDGFDLTDPVNAAFWNDPVYRKKVSLSAKPDEVDPTAYAGIHYAGGHGTMWDFADNEELAQLGAAIYEQGGVVSAVCHGPAGLANIRLSDGTYLVDGKRVSAFTDAEERAVKLDAVVPYLLESTLRQRGAQIVSSDLWQAQVSVDSRLVTGQNPASVHAVGEAMLETLASVSITN